MRTPELWPMTPDVIVLGAGAAGLMAAIHAAERKKRVLLLEKNRKPGVKILMSGGTRCNITHDGPVDEIVRAFGRGGKFLRPSLRAFPPVEVVRFFNEIGVATKTEPPHRKVFPKTDRATTVQQALVEKARAVGVELRGDSPVLSLRANEGGFLVATPAGELRAAKVIVATGGQSYPGCGTRGDGYAIARAFGHTIVAPRPALVPINLERPLDDCSGVSLVDARVGLAVKGGKMIASRRGELLFTHRGLSGPTALDLSSELTARTSGVVRDAAGPFEVALDLLPEVTHEKLGAELGERKARTVAVALQELGLPRRLGQALLRRASVPEARTLQELRREERVLVVRSVKDLRVGATGTLGFEKAEVTAGGVALDEIEPGTLASRRAPGLFFIGEVLDVDGPVGGYNFQAAWSTGRAAAAAL